MLDASAIQRSRNDCQLAMQLSEHHSRILHVSTPHSMLWMLRTGPVKIQNRLCEEVVLKEVTKQQDSSWAAAIKQFSCFQIS